MVWKKDANGNWGNFHEPPTSEPDRQSEAVSGAASDALDDISYDGTQMTSVTVEEVYNAVNNTVEQKKVRGGNNRSRNFQSSNPPTHHDDHEGDSRSMSSMSMLFRNARGDRQQSKPSNYANYHYDDDDESVDSLSDVFGNKTVDKKKKKESLVQKWANSKAQAKTILEEKKANRKANDETLDGIIGDVANLHDQASLHQIDDIPDPHDSASFVDIPVGGPDENEKIDLNDSAAGSTKEMSITESEDHDSCSKTSSSSSSSSRRTKSKRGMSNKKMCCWVFGCLIVIAASVVVFFQVYYRMQGKTDVGVSSPNDSVSNVNDNVGDVDDENTVDENIVDIDAEFKIPSLPPQPPPTQRPTQRPTKYGETSAPTDSRAPTNRPTLPHTQHPTTGPTENYINPLMEFLQDNQVYFERDPLSPNFMAVQWLANEAQFRSMNGISSAYGNGLELNEKVIQRFALLTLDYSLNRPNVTADSFPLKQDRQKIAQTALTYSAFEYETYERTHTIAVNEVDECSWEGVVCASVGSAAGKVEEIDFSYAGLTGTIPPEIKLLHNLKKLNIAGNDIHGSIPNSIYKIQGLEELYLYKNHLTGTISANIANWWNLTHLHLSHNELSGSIPLTFKSDVQIRPVRYLNLYSNQLTGTIPNLRFRKLTFADFGRNQFIGTLPEDIGLRWVELRYLYLDHNQFTGTIPYSYPTTGNGRVEAMALNHNNLTGYVPGQFYHNKLLEFNVQNNTFTGIDYQVCYQSVFDNGEMVEYKADCNICKCDPFCERKCDDKDSKGKW
mmetsp:Transcript_19533/g.45502  ORF Transcript_19533/g.45502 Transcript_19533/m.45502 type:complete len:783 (+) Transcript_19533:234-2582(+)|eukprot:CAMPEP_0197186426 /NCGR_PEP_ID=MMETSP1423-20130617/13893_1 /TAXON_ID=476441 /ORGANISM="Pseudo-nitzschia heimii, Strain UNC1101" /LENGTH=782 /DNA_ID=CAMNT_0042637743 /DNA_START=100 /DNA_END=2448 /DNA_ORIENTATION=-